MKSCAAGRYCLGQLRTATTNRFGILQLSDMLRDCSGGIVRAQATCYSRKQAALPAATLI